MHPFRLARGMVLGLASLLLAALPTASTAMPQSSQASRASTAAICADASAHCFFLPWMRTPAARLTLSPLSTLPGISRAVKVHGNYAYASDAGHLLVIDMRDPQRPAIVGRYQFTGRVGPYVVDIEIQPPLAYVATNERFTSCCIESMVNLLDITQPTRPVLRDRRGGIGVNDLAVADQRVYVAGIHWIYSAPDLAIYDVVNGSNLAPRGTFGGDGSTAVAVIGSTVYLADDELGIHVVDVSNPDQPMHLGTFDTPGSAHGVQVVGSELYVADGEAGLSVFDLSVPQQPVLRANRQTLGEARRLHVVDGRAYIAEGYSGLSIIDVRNLTEMELLATYDTPGYAAEVHASGTLLYVADNDSGLHILQMSR
jgi:hypothetical protein